MVLSRSKVGAYQGRTRYRNQGDGSSYAVVGSWDTALTLEVSNKEIVQKVKNYADNLLKDHGFQEL